MQCCEDFALMRSIKAAYKHQGSVYLRFGHLAVPVFHDEATLKFEIGKGEQFTEDNDVAIFASGLEGANRSPLPNS